MLLEKVRELLSDPSHWSRGAWARDAAGKACEPNSPDACSFCLSGAMMRLGGADWQAISEAAWAVEKVTGEAAYQFSDKASHPQLMRAIDEAIERLKCSNS